MIIKKGPWTIVATKCVYKNPWISVREDKVIRPDGKDGIFGVVTIKPGITVLPMDNEGNVYLIEEYRYALEKETIEAVSGGIENNEDILDAAKRELKEETGIEAKKWISLGTIDPISTIVNLPSHLFLAKDLTFFESNPEGTEKIKLIKVSFEQAIDWVIKGLITDSITSTLILKIKNL